VLLRTEDGRAALSRYFRDFLELARRQDAGCLLETATWRASRDWAPRLGLTVDELGSLNRNAVRLLQDLKNNHSDVDVIVSGCLGPRGDGYDPGTIMSAEEASDYHGWQAEILAREGADMLSAITMTNVNEAIGVARAAERTGRPVAISFTVETDGLLPTGATLEQAIGEVDRATDAYPAYYMINCAHPTHFAAVLQGGGSWVDRIQGIRANASRCSHAELDAMTELDDGNPEELGQEYRELRRRLPQLTVLGGCCGTDIRHVTAIAEAISA
jgi:S-methylmethionine-dependent homocysteine/selenocysteine methylase